MLRTRIKEGLGHIKMPLSRLTISEKMTLMYGVIFEVGLILITALIMFSVISLYQNNSRKELNETADKVKAYIEAGGTVSNDAIRQLVSNDNMQVGIQEINQSGKHTQFGVNFPPDSEDQPKPGSVVDIQAVRYMFGQQLATYNGHTYNIRVYRNYEHEQSNIRLFAAIFMIINMLGLIAAAFIGRGVARVSLTPIRRMTQTAEQISIEDLSRRIAVTGPKDELRELALTFNEMIDRLERSFKATNQFVSDASHELRTPIAVIQGYANLIDRWGKRDPEVLQESIDSIKAETEHMAKLIEKLLMIAKTDQNRLTVSKRPMLLSQVAEDVAKEMEIMQYGAQIELNISEESEVFADYDLIKQLYWIFIENAIKYSTDDKLIKIIIGNDGDHVNVSVKDHGIGIDASDLPNIFERFYRADKSRSNSAPGTGLGLSIAAWIIKQHDAEVDVQSEVGRGTTFTVHFPKYNKG